MVSEQFENLKCIKEDANTKEEIIALTKSCITWIASEQQWREEYQRIDYESAWYKTTVNGSSVLIDKKNNYLEKKNKTKNTSESFRHKKRSKYTPEAFRLKVKQSRDDCEVVDNYEDDKKRISVKCNMCGRISGPLLPEQIIKGKKLDCFDFHKFEEMMKEKHKSIQYYAEDFHKDSKDSRFNHIGCICLICGCEWKPSVDSLKREHGCPNYRDERHGVKIRKVNSWKNGSNSQVSRDDGVFYKSQTEAAKKEGVSKARLRKIIREKLVLNGHCFIVVVRDKRIRRISTGEIFKDINDAEKITGKTKGHIYRQISKKLDFEWVISRCINNRKELVADNNIQK